MIITPFVYAEKDPITLLAHVFHRVSHKKFEFFGFLKNLAIPQPRHFPG